MVKPAAVSGARSAAGPLPDCGYAVRSSSTPVQMLGTPPDYFWWLEMSYLASDDGTVQLTIHGHPHLVPVRKGLHRLLIQREGPVSSWRLAA